MPLEEPQIKMIAQFVLLLDSMVEDIPRKVANMSIREREAYILIFTLDRMFTPDPIDKAWLITYPKLNEWFGRVKNDLENEPIHELL